MLGAPSVRSQQAPQPGGCSVPVFLYGASAISISTSTFNILDIVRAKYAREASPAAHQAPCERPRNVE